MTFLLALLVLAAVLAWVRRSEGRAQAIRPAVERSNVRACTCEGWRQMGCVPDGAPDMDRHIAEAVAVGDGRDLAARVVARRDDWRPTLRLINQDRGTAQ